MEEREWVVSSEFIGGDLEEASSPDAGGSFEEQGGWRHRGVCEEALGPLVELASFVETSDEGVEFIVHGVWPRRGGACRCVHDRSKCHF